MSKLLAAVLVALSPLAMACEVEPPQQLASDAELVARTANIVLARVTKVEGDIPWGDAVYTFETVERLRGNLPAVFKVSGVAAKEGPNDHFQNHTEEIFRNNGRLANWPDCEIHPSFVLNRPYLVFYDQPYHRKSFERIADPANDKWLSDVRALLARH